jgi:lipopolysaccharide/colanic/teichoic acid biosynthesis glycosyltransferase
MSGKPAGADPYEVMMEEGNLSVTDLTVRKEATASDPAREAVKRALDIALASVLIVIAAPLLLVLGCLVRSTSVGPVFFRQERLGRDMKPFTMLKLRSMYVSNDDRMHRAYVTGMLTAKQEDTERNGGLFKLVGDPRITPLGTWLRRTSLDELPQLINVLRGDMSLVGPRPMLPWEARLLAGHYRLRFTVKPGITGLWQVSGRSQLSMREALELDVEYARRRSVVFDLTILARTVPALFRGGAS